MVNDRVTKLPARVVEISKYKILESLNIWASSSTTGTHIFRILDVTALIKINTAISDYADNAVSSGFKSHFS